MAQYNSKEVNKIYPNNIVELENSINNKGVMNNTQK